MMMTSNKIYDVRGRKKYQILQHIKHYEKNSQNLNIMYSIFFNQYIDVFYKLNNAKHEKYLFILSFISFF